MDKGTIREYFDRCAPAWDAGMQRCEEKISFILDQAGVREGADVLDVACGTGVLIPDYLKRKVRSVTAIDLSPEMVRLAREKFPREDVNILCGDVEDMAEERAFDCIVVYNAFPHFPDPERLIRKLSAMLRPSGTLTVAHGMSRAMVDLHHSGSAHSVSIGLMHEDRLADLFAKTLTVTVKISNDEMYQVTGRLDT